MKLLVLIIFHLQLTRSLDPKEVDFLGRSHFLPTTAYSEYYYNPQALSIEILDESDWKSISRKYAGSTILQKITEFLGLDFQSKGLGEISYALSDLTNHLKRLNRPQEALSCKIANFDALLIEIENIIKDHAAQDTSPKPLVRNKRGKRPRTKAVVNYQAWSYETSYNKIFQGNLIFNDLSEQEKKNYIISTALYFGQKNRRNMLIKIFKKANWEYSELDSEKKLRIRYRVHLAQKLGIDYFPGQIWRDWVEKNKKRSRNNQDLIDQEINQYNIANNVKTDEQIDNTHVDNEDDIPINIDNSFDNVPTIDSDDDMEGTLDEESDVSGNAQSHEKVIIKIDHRTGPTDRKDDFVIDNSPIRNKNIIRNQVTKDQTPSSGKIEPTLNIPSLDKVPETGDISFQETDSTNNIIPIETSDDSKLFVPIETSDDSKLFVPIETSDDSKLLIPIETSDDSKLYDKTPLNTGITPQQVGDNFANNIASTDNNKQTNQQTDEKIDSLELDHSDNKFLEEIESIGDTDDIEEKGMEVMIDREDPSRKVSDEIINSLGSSDMDLTDGESTSDGSQDNPGRMDWTDKNKPNLIPVPEDNLIMDSEENNLGSSNNLRDSSRITTGTRDSSRITTGTLNKKDQEVQTDITNNFNFDNGNSIKMFNKQLQQVQNESKEKIEQINLKLQGKEKLLIDTTREKTCLENEKSELIKEKDRLTEELSTITMQRDNFQTLLANEKEEKEREKKEKEGCLAEKGVLSRENNILQEGIDRRDEETKTKSNNLGEKDRTIALLSLNNQDLTDKIKLSDSKLENKQLEYERLLNEKSILEGKILEKREIISEKERDIRSKDNEIKKLVGNIFDIRSQQIKLIEESRYTIDFLKAERSWTERQDKEIINGLKEENRQLRLNKRSEGEELSAIMDPKNHDITRTVGSDQESDMLIDNFSDDVYKELSNKIETLPEKIKQNILDNINDKFKTLSDDLRTNRLTISKLERRMPRDLPSDGTIVFQEKSDIPVTSRAVRVQKIIDALKGKDSDLTEKVHSRIMHEILLVKSFLEYVVPTDEKPKVINPLIFSTCNALNAQNSPLAILYQDETIQYYKNNHDKGYKYEPVFFGLTPKYKLDKDSVYSPEFPPNKICNRVIIIGKSIYCTEKETKFEDLTCAFDTKHICDYIFDFRTGANRKLILGLKYTCNEDCEIIGQSGGLITKFIISNEIIKEYFHVPRIGDVWATILTFFKTWSWTILAWLSFTGFNSFIIIYSCLVNFFFKGATREFRWFPMSKKDLTNLVKCICCRKQDPLPAQYELIPVRPNQVVVTQDD